jgi:hypothetical protein
MIQELDFNAQTVGGKMVSTAHIPTVHTLARDYHLEAFSARRLELRSRL